VTAKRTGSIAERPNPRRAGRTGGEVVAFPTEPSRDEELWQGLADARPVALSELFDRYAPPVRRLLTRMLDDASAADDLTQETFLVVLRRLRDIRPDALRSFVMATAVRTAKNELRRRAVRRWVGLGASRPVLVLEPCDVVVREQVVRLQGVLQALEPEARALFLLRHLEGLELTELASSFRCSLATIKRRLVRVEARFEALARSDSALRALVPEALKATPAGEAP
jgi:RNA polymerase sigma-70 factor, ECF subfamily